MASSSTVARGRYTVEEVSPQNPANQPPPPSLLSRFMCCLCAVCRCVGRNLLEAACPGGSARRRTFALGGLAVLALVGINHLVMTPAIEHKLGRGEGKSGGGLRGGGGKGSGGGALEQSYGLLRDVPESQWLALREGVKKKRDEKAAANGKKEPSDFSSPAEFYDSQWPAEFSCPEAGGPGGNVGGWELCNPGGIAAASAERETTGGGCLIYVSTGAADFAVEEALLKAVGECEIVTFREKAPGGGAATAQVAPPVGVSAQFYRFKGSQLQVEGDYKSMQDAVKSLGHTGRTVDAFVLDCPGCEWDIYKDWFGSGVTFRQIVVKVHSTPPIVNDFFSTMQSQGFVISNKVPDGDSSQTYSFLNLSPDFFI